jgi:hypothetical protein
VLPIAVGPLYLDLGAARSLTPPARVLPDDTLLGRLRAGHAAEGLSYYAQSAEYAYNRSAALFFGVGAAGIASVAGGVARTVRVRKTSLTATAANIAPPSVPAGASDALALAPGESVAIERDGTLSLAAGTLHCFVDESAPQVWLGGGVGVDFSMAHTGQSRTEVIRCEDDVVLLRISGEDSRSRTIGAGFNIGIYADVALTGAIEVARRIGSASETASEMVQSSKWRSVSSGANIGHSSAQGEERLADYRLHMNNPKARTAYEAAMRGDLRLIQAYAIEGDAGVRLLYSLAANVRKTVIPVSLGLFGIGISWERSRSARDSQELVDGQCLRKRRTIDTLHRSVTDLTLRTTGETSSVERVRHEGRPEGDGTVTWMRTIQDRTTSREEVLHDVQMAELMLADQAPESLHRYRGVLAALDPHRFAGIGPRDEAGTTESILTVSFSGQECLRISAADAGAVWEALSLWHAVVEGGPPAWASADARRGFDADAADGVLSWRELSPVYLLDRQSYREARRFVEGLHALGTLPAWKAATVLRDAIGTGSKSVRNVGVLCSVVRPQQFRLELSVDSNKGLDGGALDYAFVWDPTLPPPG